MDLDVAEDDAPFRISHDLDRLSRLIDVLTEREIVANRPLKSQTKQYKTAIV